MAVVRRNDSAGGVVTMPYKETIMMHLDKLGEKCMTLGSCNHVAVKEGKLIDSNIDSIGILEPLRKTLENGVGRPAMMIGAGGASRAAHCMCIWIVRLSISSTVKNRKSRVFKQTSGHIVAIALV